MTKKRLRCVYDEKIKKFVLLPKNIYYQNQAYEIRKRINNTLTYWGRFQTITDAIKEDKHFFEDLGRKLDAEFKGDDCND